MTKTAGQRLALRQLADIERARPGALEVLGTHWVGHDQGTLRIDVSLDLAGVVHAPGGIRMRARERFLIEVGTKFPYAPPMVSTPHQRWAGTPHVQIGRVLCLYAAPSVEWQPGDGMRGLIERLLLWVEKAAVGELDPEDRPLHPPVAYTGSADEQVVVRADLGTKVPWSGASSQNASYLIAVCEQRDERLDVVEWQTPEEFERRLSAGDQTVGNQDVRRMAVAAVLINGELGFEYPSQARALADGLYKAGVEHEAFMELIALVASANAIGAAARAHPMPLVVVVGTPSRRLGDGPRLAHLVAWRLDDFAEQVAGLLTDVNRLDLPALRDKVLALGESWLGFATTDWLQVWEDRAEVTARRDADSSASWLADKRILVLGCGALGAPAAEFCMRAGASVVTVADNGMVTPGILVRQPYTDDDIGRPKAEALAKRLRTIRRTTTVNDRVVDAIGYAQPDSEILTFDLVIDATADTGVRAALESARRREADDWPPLLTLLIGHDARRGLMALSRGGATGSGHDIFRRFGLAVNGPYRDRFADIAADFYPYPPRSATFQPEPGCSSPTFVGSAAEVTALSAMMMTAGLDALTGQGPVDSQQPMAVAAVRLSSNHDGVTTSPGGSWLGWPNDATAWERSEGFQVRLSQAALAEIRAEVRRGARLRGERVETGGMLIGALDEAVGCIFIDAAAGPPPDSRLSEVYFAHGVVGAQETVDYHARRSHKASGFVGMWHTHPHGVAKPSKTDEAGMAALVTPVDGGPTQALMMILAGTGTTWTAWRDTPAGGVAVPEIFARLVRRADRDAPLPIPSAPPGTYYPGGFGSPVQQQRPARQRSWRWLRIRRGSHA